MAISWASIKERKRGYTGSKKLAEDALPCLAKLLGKLHGIDKSPIFWEPIIGPWLRYFAVIYIDRVEEYIRDNKENAFLEKSLIPKETWSAPEDWYNFDKSQALENFISQLFSQIRFFNKKESLNNDNNAETESIKQKKFYEKTIISLHPKQVFMTLGKGLYVHAAYLIFLMSVVLYRGNLVIISPSLFNRRQKMKFFILSYGRIVFYPSLAGLKTIRKLFRVFHKNTGCNKRTELITLGRAIMLADRSFRPDKTFWNVLMRQIPQAHVEDFQYIYSLSKMPFVKSPKCVYTDGQHFVDEVFKVSMGTWRANGTNVLIAQHGGNSMTDFDSLFDHDLSVSSTYFSWGWKNESPKIKPMPSMRISVAKERFQKEPFSGQGNILYVCRALCSNQRGSFAHTVQDSSAIRSGRRKLADYLSEIMKKDFIIRSRSADMWGDNSNSIEEFQDAGFLIASPGKKISALFSEARIVIFESVSTGFAECLACDKPAVLFLSENYMNFENDVARDFLNLLERFGIIFYTVETLSAFLQKDISHWWNSGTRQTIKSELRNKFALTSDDYIRAWVREFEEISSGTVKQSKELLDRKRREILEYK